MNIDSGSSSSHTSETSQDFELNLAPIVDCFTVLITFMLVSASFLAIGILDTTPEAAGQAVADAQPELEKVQIELQPNFTLEVRATGQTVLNQQVAGVPGVSGVSGFPGAWDFASLNRILIDLKQRTPQLNRIVLTATNTVEYLEIMRCMEELHKLFPSIALGGF